MVSKVYRNAEDREGRIVELAGGLFTIPSFTHKDKVYKTDPRSGYCSCKRYEYRGACAKHVSLAEAVAKVRERASRVRFFSSRNAEAELVEIAKAVYAKVEKGESSVESYELLLRTITCRHSTDALKRQAYVRHSHVLVLNEVRETRRAA